MEFISNRGFLWLTYMNLKALVVRTAQAIRSLVPVGSFVGISGYNGIEWAVCDLACALAGCVSVGIHTTFDSASALHAIRHTQVSLLFCFSDLVYEKSMDGDLKRGGEKLKNQLDFWSVQSIMSESAKEGTSLIGSMGS
jgi:long-subunit acyl-CoA synthetase (AMP-forming)